MVSPGVWVLKKSVVAVLVLLALAVIVSPGIVGRVAEDSMGRSLEWAARESGEVSVTSARFERGWFSSAGQHRVSLKEGDLLETLQALAGPIDADALPVLIINTRLDHGLIPVTSMSREGGSLTPGLGSAVSTLQLELPDGTLIDIPGTVYSRVGLGGTLHARYVLPAGRRSTDDGTTAEWADSSLEVSADAMSGAVEFSGSSSSISLVDDAVTFSIGGLTFSGEERPTDFGLWVGRVALDVHDVSHASGGMPAEVLRSLSLRAETALDGDRVNAASDIAFTIPDVPDFGDVSGSGRLTLSGADALALGRLQRALEAAGQAADPMSPMAAIEPDFATMLARGVAFDVERFDIALPDGTVTLAARFETPEGGSADSGLLSLVLGAEASLDVSIPAPLMERMMVENPQAAMLVGMGYLRRQDDVFAMELRYRKKLATINGAPLPLPIPD